MARVLWEAEAEEPTAGQAEKRQQSKGHWQFWRWVQTNRSGRRKRSTFYARRGGRTCQNGINNAQTEVQQAAEMPAREGKEVPKARRPGPREEMDTGDGEWATQLESRQDRVDFYYT